jgi:RNA polymerase sigma factor (sigma-70 family)
MVFVIFIVCWPFVHRTAFTPYIAKEIHLLTTLLNPAFVVGGLGIPTGCWQSSRVNPPDLRALRIGDADAWDDAFRWLWPTAFAAAQVTLQPYFPNDVEDVAIESLEELVGTVRKLNSVEELRPLAASIAHHRAVSFLRERFAKKRGEGKTESLDAAVDEAGRVKEPASELSPLSDIEQKELAERLHRSLADLRPPLGEVLSDFFLKGLRYEEIAKNRKMAVGSVGVHLKRGLEAIRRIWEQDRDS